MATQSVTCRHALQSFDSCIDDFSAQPWGQLVDSAVGSLRKQDLVLAHVLALGLRNPTEATLNILSSLVMAVCLGVERAKQVAESGKHAHLVAVV